MSSMRTFARTPASRICAPAIPKSSQARIEREDLAREVAAVQIAGGLARDDHDSPLASRMLA